MLGCFVSAAKRGKRSRASLLGDMTTVWQFWDNFEELMLEIRLKFASQK
jgi:hypothetical protein